VKVLSGIRESIRINNRDLATSITTNRLYEFMAKEGVSVTDCNLVMSKCDILMKLMHTPFSAKSEGMKSYLYLIKTS
jgi:hypothetical protein